MFDRIISELGPWNWMVLGLVLLVMEVIAPGIFMLWIGIAALLIGVVSLLIWDASFWTWEVQVLAFLALSLVSAFAGKKLVGGRHDATDQPLLNRRGAQMVGKMATLAEPISDEASIGISTIFEFGAVPIDAMASVYFCATK